LSLVKTGTGTFSSNAASTFTGGTTVSQGTIQASVATGFGIGAITLADSNTAANNVAFLSSVNGVTFANNFIVRGGRRPLGMRGVANNFIGRGGRRPLGSRGMAILTWRSKRLRAGPTIPSSTPLDGGRARLRSAERRRSARGSLRSMISLGRRRGSDRCTVLSVADFAMHAPHQLERSARQTTIQSHLWSPIQSNKGRLNQAHRIDTDTHTRDVSL
jgi:autotransporter-associated beta strand protein